MNCELKALRSVLLYNLASYLTFREISRWAFRALATFCNVPKVVLLIPLSKRDMADCSVPTRIANCFWLRFSSFLRAISCLLSLNWGSKASYSLRTSEFCKRRALKSSYFVLIWFFLLIFTCLPNYIIIVIIVISNYNIYVIIYNLVKTNSRDSSVVYNHLSYI